MDTGNAGERDLGRIAETLRTAGVTKIDHLWTTHYHGDHVGALLELAKQFPVGHFYDHGKPHANDRIVSAQFLSAYEALSSGKRTIVKPGDKVKMTGLDITAVASANQFIRRNLPGGGSQNASCAGVKPKDESAYPDPDNGDSAGFVLTYGRFRTIDLGDLTWNGELDLMCPTNRIGTVDLYLTSHHGLEKSGSPALVQALRPRVVVMNNGTRKGGTAEAFAGLQETVGIEDLWQLHWSYNVGLENAPARFIANVDDPATIATVLTTPPTPGIHRRRAPADLAAPVALMHPAGAAAPEPPRCDLEDQGRPEAVARRAVGRDGPGGPGAAAHTPAHLIKVTALAGRHVHRHQHAQRIQQDLSAAAVGEPHVLVADCTIRSATASCRRRSSALPVVTLFFVLVALKKRVWVAALSGFVVAVALALFVFGMPAALVGTSAVHGVIFGLMRIAWIVVGSIFLYNVACETGQFEVMKASIAGLSSDKRLQLVLVAFCFGAFLEGCRRRRRAGGDCRVVPHRTRLQTVRGSDALPSRQHGAGRVGWRRQPHTHAGRRDRVAGSGVQRDGRTHSAADLADPAALAGAQYGRLARDAAGLAGAAREWRLLRGDAVLLVQLPGRRTRRHRRGGVLAAR